MASRHLAYVSAFEFKSTAVRHPKNMINGADKKKKPFVAFGSAGAVSNVHKNM